MSLFIKRVFDVMVAGAGLVLLSPVMGLIALWIKADSRGPIFFRQVRAGRGGKPFTIYKFRTMVEGAEKGGYYTAAEDPRITRVGRFLRATSLDELPQLWNILKGEMSVVGPRPTLLYQVEQYNERQRKRLEMRPGVTGWAQVNGRNALSWPERIELDVWYVEHWSLWLDLKILMKTLVVWLRGEGVYAEKEKFVVGAGDMEHLVKGGG
ncbi:MAG: sugar transferase [bacterium]|nr:sugar transferase [bacterium]